VFLLSRIYESGKYIKVSNLAWNITAQTVIKDKYVTSGACRDEPSLYCYESTVENLLQKERG